MYSDNIIFLAIVLSSIYVVIDFIIGSFSSKKSTIAEKNFLVLESVSKHDREKKIYYCRMSLKNIGEPCIIGKVKMMPNPRFPWTQDCIKIWKFEEYDITNYSIHKVMSKVYFMFSVFKDIKCVSSGIGNAYSSGEEKEIFYVEYPEMMYKEDREEVVTIEEFCDRYVINIEYRTLSSETWSKTIIALNSENLHGEVYKKDGPFPISK